MGKKSKEARRARRDAQRANADRSSVEGAEEETDADFECIVQMVVNAVKASGAAVPPRARKRIAESMWQHGGDISYGTVLTIMDESGVVESEDQTSRLWHCMKLEIAEHNASANGATGQQQQHEQVLVAIATTEAKGKKASEKGGKGGKTEAPGVTKAHASGAKARGHGASETLGLALSSIKRKAKPRSDSGIDEILWTDARKIAETELEAQFKMQTSVEFLTTI